MRTEFTIDKQGHKKNAIISMSIKEYNKAMELIEEMEDFWI